MTTTKTYLGVPYDEKDQAKSLGAKWDSYVKQWYVPKGIDVSKFSQWDTSKCDYFDVFKEYKSGDTFTEKNRAYKVISCKHVPFDEEINEYKDFYRVFAIDISDTEKGLELIEKQKNKTSKRNKL